MSSKKLSNLDKFEEAKSIANPLVLVIAVSEYSPKENNLNCVESDRQLFIETCKSKGFTICPSFSLCSEYHNKKYWSQQDIFKFIEVARKQLYWKENQDLLKHDSIILYFSGHGSEGCVVSSDGEYIKIYDLQSKISSIWKASTSTIPKLCIWDCCRGVINKKDKILNSNGGHKDELFCSIYGNSAGIVTKGTKAGSFFTRSLCSTLKNDKNLELMNITDFTIKINEKLKKKSKNLQIVSKEGDPNLDKYSISNKNDIQKHTECGSGDFFWSNIEEIIDDNIGILRLQRCKKNGIFKKARSLTDGHCDPYRIILKSRFKDKWMEIYHSVDLNQIQTKFNSYKASVLQFNSSAINSTNYSIDEIKEDHNITDKYFKTKSTQRLSLEGQLKQARLSLERYINPKVLSKDNIPKWVLRKAKGLVFLTVIKVGFLLAGNVGTGCIIVRRANGSWTGPSSIGCAGVSVGVLAGASKVDYIMILPNDYAVSQFTGKGQLRLGGELQLALGPVGREGSGSVGAGDKGFSVIYSYSHAQGLYGGLALDGKVISVRSDCNKSYYKKQVSCSDILTGNIDKFPPNKDYDIILYLLNNYCLDKDEMDQIKPFFHNDSQSPKGFQNQEQIMTVENKQINPKDIAKNSINQCQSCHTMKEGTIDVNDGLFYCTKCWKLPIAYYE